MINNITVKLLGLMFGMLMNSILFAGSIAVFISFSMPPQLLHETLTDSAKLHIPAYLNGLHNNSMHDTAVKVMALSKTIPHLYLQIDPTAFERFGITQVPALVVANDNTFDVIYGNLPLAEGLQRIIDSGDSGLTAAAISSLTQSLDHA